MPQDGEVKNCIITNLDNCKLAIEVDEVVEISDIKPDNITQMPILVRNSETRYLDRVANVDGKLIVLLDVTKLLTKEEEESVVKLAEDMQ